MNYSAELTQQFCQRWLAKAATYAGDDPASAIDQFFSVYVAYNRLYSFLAESTGLPIRGDHIQATQDYANTVGRDQLWDDLVSAGLLPSITRLASLIGPGGQFFITFDRTTHQPDMAADAGLRRDLEQGPPHARVDALLELLYQVRCNLFHGRKGYEERQLALLRPSVGCLRSVLATGLARLSFAV